MKILLLICCLFLSGSISQGQLQEGSQNFSRGVQWAALQSTVKISVRSGNRQSCGSGVIVGKSDRSLWILTASHVVDHDGDLAVTFYWWDRRPMPPRRYDSKRIVSRNRVGDVALIEMNTAGEVPRGIPICPVGRKPIGTGSTPVLSVGCDHGRTPDCWTAWAIGRATKTTNYSRSSFVVVQREPANGRSGGPLVSVHGQVIGICVAGGGGEGYFASLQTIYQVCDNAGASWLYSGKNARVVNPGPVIIGNQSVPCLVPT